MISLNDVKSLELLSEHTPRKHYKGFIDGEEAVFVKIATLPNLDSKNPKQILRKLELILLDKARSRAKIIPRVGFDISQMQNEFETLLQWKEHQIATVDPLGYGKDYIITQYIPNATSADELLAKDYNPDLMNSVMNSFNKIRSVALKHNNPKLLHSDPTVGNFLVTNQNNYQENILAIDPAQTINDSSWNIQRIDEAMLVYSMEYLAGRIGIENNNQDRAIAYMKILTESLDEPTLKGMQDYHNNIAYPGNWLPFTYFAARELAIKTTGKRDMQSIHNYAGTHLEPRQLVGRALEDVLSSSSKVLYRGAESAQ